MNGVKCFSTICLLILMLAAVSTALARDRQDVKQQRVEREMVDSGPGIPEMPPMFGMNGSDEMELMALADKEMEGNDENRRDHRKHAERIQLFRLWKIMEEVNLTDEQVDKFFPLMREYGKQERELAGQRGKLLRSLRKELHEEGPSDSKLKETLAQLKDNSRKIVESKNKAIDDAAKILSVQQQAKLALSLHEVERNIWESIARIRHMPVSNQRNFDLDKQKLHLNMQQLKENLERIKQEFESQGLPVPDINFERDGEVELKFRGQTEKEEKKEK